MGAGRGLRRRYSARIYRNDGGVDSGLFAVIRRQVVRDGGISGMTGRWNNALAVIPAKAGIQESHDAVVNRLRCPSARAVPE